MLKGLLPASGFIAAIVALVSPVAATGSETIIPRVDQGFYWDNGGGSHDPTNEGLLCGKSLPNPTVVTSRDFFVFDLPAGDGTVTYAELQIFLNHQGYLSSDPSETYEVYDVSTPIDDLRAGGSNLLPIFDDLGSGVIYGNVVVTLADELTAVKVPLNGTFIGIANSTAGGQIALGAALTSFDFDDQTQEQIFAKAPVPASLRLVKGATPTATPGSGGISTPSPQPTVTVVVPPHLDDADTAKAGDKCAGTILKSAAGLVAKRRKIVEGCAGHLFACLETKPAGAKRDACTDKARAKCSDGLAKTDATAKLEAAFAKSCGTLASDTLLGGAGLGFLQLTTACHDRFSIDVIDAATAAACLLAHHECTADGLVGHAIPRARELVAGPGITTPSCLQGASGSGLAVADPKVGKAVDNCQKAIVKASAAFAAAKLKHLAKCLDTVFGCVELKSAAEQFPPCIAKAKGTCDKAFGAIADAATALAPKIDAKCTAVGPALFSDGGIDLDSSVTATTCAAHGVAAVDTLSAYETCLFRQHECAVEDLVAFEAPRAAELLGLVGRPLGSVFCPSGP